jgi:phosphoserine phosphatase RsbU/P
LISELQSSGLLFWQQLMKLGEQIVSQNNVAAQKDLVIAAAQRLVGGNINLWLTDEAYPLPGQPENLDTEPPSDELAQKSLATLLPQFFPDQMAGSTVVFSAAYPLISQDTLLGILQVECSEDRPLRQPELDALQALVYVAATNMQVYRQVAIKNWRFEQLALVRSVSFQIANVLDLDELARRVTGLILHTFRYYYVAIFTLEPGHQKLTFRASCKFSNEKSAEVETNTSFVVQLGEGIVGYVAQSGNELVACKVEEEPHFKYIETLPETRSESSFPLKIGDRVLGVLDVQSDQPDAFHEIDILVIRALSDNIALAVEGARLYQGMRKHADQIAIVAEIGRLMTSILDLNELLSQVVALIHTRLGYPFVHLFTVQTDDEMVVFQAGSGSRSQSMQAAEVAYKINDPQGIIPWVARNRKSFISNDVSQDPLYRPNPLASTETRAELALPLVFNNNILGVLDIQSDQLNVFDPHELPVFQSLADSVAIAIRNANVYREEQWRRQVAESLRDVAWLLTANSSLEKVLSTILSELERNLPCELAAVWLYGDVNSSSENPDTLSLAAIHSKDQTNLELAKAINPQVDYCLTSALSSSQPFIRDPRDPLGSLGITLDFPQDFSMISAPLLAREQVLGVIALANTRSRSYGADSSAMLATFASYAAVAIENTRLFATAQEQAWISTVLLQVAEATQSLTSVEDLISSVVRLTPLLIGIKGSAFFLWNADAEIFELKATHNLSVKREAATLPDFFEPTLIPAFNRLISSKQPVLIINPAEELMISPQLASDLGLNALVLNPVQAQSDLLGAFLIALDTIPYTDENLNKADDERLAIIQGITQQTAVALQNIRLLEAKQEEAYVTAVLLQVAQTVVSTNEIHDILESIVQIIPILVGIDSSVIYLWDNDRELFIPTSACCGSDHFDETFFEYFFTPGSYPLLDSVWASGNTILCSLNQTEKSAYSWNTILIPDQSASQPMLFNNESLLMGFPISVKGERYGVFLASDSSSSRSKRTRRIEILSGIAQQISLALQNDRLKKEMVGRERLEREFQLARQIQRTFLPTQLPNLPGWDIDIRWRTARQVGGDFYDFIDLSDGSIGLVIADVSDKGLAAALYMTVTRTLIRASVRELRSPARILEHVNDLLLYNSQSGLFVTAFYAILNPSSGIITYANAGHNLPLISRRKDRKVICLAQGGIALGALGEIELTDHQEVIEPGDCMLLFTDGATETFSPVGELYGDERLSIAFQNADVVTAKSVLDFIDADLDGFRLDEPVSDDITLMVVKRQE